MTRRRRLAALALIAVLLVGAVVADRSDPPAPEEGLTAAATAEMPVAAPAGARASTWFCVGGTAVPDGAANVSVVVANTTDEPRTGAITWAPEDRAVAPVRRDIVVAPLSVVTAAAVESLQTGFVAATVELDGGGVAVEQTVTGTSGRGAATPCATDAARTWHLAYGTTARDAVEHVVLYNPFPGDAIVDVEFATDEGRALPQSLEGFVIEAGRVAAVNLDDHAVRRREQVAVTVTARTGRLVAGRLQRFDGSAGRVGLGVGLGAPTPSLRWYFPDGIWTSALRERVHIYNPNDREAVVDVVLTADDVEVPPEPIELTIAPHTTFFVDMQQDGRVPAGVAHAITVDVVNDVPVVAERETTSVSRSSRRGSTATLGARQTSERWVFAAGGPSATLDQWLVVLNPGTAPTTVTFTGLAGGQTLAIDGLQQVEVGAGGRLAVRLGEHVRRPDLPVVVEASEPVVVERGLFAVQRPGMSSAIGIPLR